MRCFYIILNKGKERVELYRSFNESFMRAENKMMSVRKSYENEGKDEQR